MVLVSVFFLFSCSGYRYEKRDTGIGPDAEADKLLTHFLDTGQGDSLIKYVYPVYREYEGKKPDEGYVRACLYMAEAYLHKNRYDSVSFYLDRMMASGLVEENPLYKMAYDNISAIHAIKTSWNYPEAVRGFLNAYASAVKVDDKYNQAIFLCNASAIYFMREDSSGFKYARMAYDIASKIDYDFIRAFTAMTLAKSYYVRKDRDSSALFYNEALVLALKNRYENVLMDTYTGLATIAEDDGRVSEADSLFRLALSFDSDSSSIKTRMNYADYLLLQRRFGEAERMYRSALEMSSSIENVEYRYRVYYGMSRLYDSLDMPDSVMDYFMKGYVEERNVFNISKENELNRLFNDYTQVVYENKLQRNRYNFYLAVAVSVLVIVVCIGLYMMYRRKNRMYRQLVEQYQNFVVRTRQMEESRKCMENDDTAKYGIEKELFSRIEKLMREDKAYRMNDISLDKLAEILGSNRTYVSRTINRYTSKTFYNYINGFRVEEAVGMLSDPKCDVPLKAMADILGYNSVPVFYRSFQREVGCTPSKYREQSHIISREKGEEEDPE